MSRPQFFTFTVDGSSNPASAAKEFRSPFSSDYHDEVGRKSGEMLAPLERRQLSQTTTELTANMNASRQQTKTTEIEIVYCGQSPLQKQLYDSVRSLMTLRDSEQDKLLRLLCNHPILLYEKISELSSCLMHQASKNKKAKMEFVNYSGVASHFPARFEDGKSMIHESGKLLELVKLVFSLAEEQPRMIVVSNYHRTLDLLENLFTLLKFPVFRIDKNTPVTVLPEIVRQSLVQKDGCKVVLVNAKAERLGADLFNCSRVVFYDFEPANDSKTISRWGVDGLLDSVHRLVTLESLEEEEK